MYLKNPSEGVITEGEVLAYCQATDEEGNVVRTIAPKIGNYYNVTTIDIEDKKTLPVKGIIVHKDSPTATECKLILLGEIDGLLTGLTVDDFLFVDEDGKLVNSAPLPGVGENCFSVPVAKVLDTDVIDFDPKAYPKTWLKG